MEEVARSAVQYLLIEAVPLARDVAAQLGHEDEALVNETCYRVELEGFRVGEALAPLYTRDMPYMPQSLDVIRYVCKDLWISLFHKQMDGLKTNHRGTFVLIDNNFEMCQRMSTNLGRQRTAELAAPFLWFPAGLIRGFLSGMGINATVAFETDQLPSVTFNVETS